MIRYQAAGAQIAKPERTTGAEEITSCMAETMREMAFSGETVNAETLIQRGFTPATVERFSAEAAIIARRRSIVRIDRAA